MEDKRTQIEQALAKLISRKRWYDFQLLALQLARRKWPDLDPTEWRDDGGEDGITIPSQCSDGLRRSLACSLSGTLDKVRKDCRRIINRGVHVDDLVFYTPVVVTNLEIAEWQKKIQEEFGHSLQVIPQAPIIADLEQPDNAWLCRDYLELNFADEPDVAGLATRVRTVALASIQQWKAEYGYNPITHMRIGVSNAIFPERNPRKHPWASQCRPPALSAPPACSDGLP